MKKKLKCKVFYRFVNVEADFEEFVFLKKYYMTRETRSVYWVKRIWEEGEHPTILMDIPEWVEKEYRVSKTAAKRFAHPTIPEAINAFIHRKRKQIEILEEKLSFAKKAMKEGQAMEDEVKKAKDDRYTKEEFYFPQDDDGDIDEHVA